MTPFGFLQAVEVQADGGGQTIIFETHDVSGPRGGHQNPL